MMVAGDESKLSKGARQPRNADKRVARWRRAVAALRTWDGWPVLDVVHLAHRRRQRGGSLLRNADDALGPLNEAAADYEGRRPGESLLSQSFLSRLPTFDAAAARLKAGRTMLREAAAVTKALAPDIRSAGLDPTPLARLVLALEAAETGAVDVGEQVRAVTVLVKVLEMALDARAGTKPNSALHHIIEVVAAAEDARRPLSSADQVWAAIEKRFPDAVHAKQTIKNLLSAKERAEHGMITKDSNLRTTEAAREWRKEHPL